MVPHQSITSTADRDAFGNWLSGFIDGEGCFLLQIRKDGGRLFGSARFTLGLRRDERVVLEQIQSFWSIGSIHKHSAQKGNGKPGLCFQVCKIEDLKSVLMPHFIAYPLRAKKRKDFDIWAQGVELCYEVWCRPIVLKTSGRKGHEFRWREDDVARFMTLHEALRKQREYEAETIIPPLKESPSETQLGLFG